MTVSPHVHVCSRVGIEHDAESRGVTAAALGDTLGMRRRLLFLSRNETTGSEGVVPAFRERGWDVSVLAPCEESLTSLERQAYDLVIMEITHPGPGGYALCEELRRRSRIPLLLLVSNAARKDIVQGLDKGADAYVVEPFNMRELLVRAEALVRRAAGWSGNQPDVAGAA